MPTPTVGLHPRPRRDPHDVVVLIVVSGLLFLAVMTVGILGGLALTADEPSDLLLGALISASSAAVGALTALLTQTGRSQPPQQTVINGGGDGRVPVQMSGELGYMSLGSVIVIALAVIGLLVLLGAL